MNFPHEFPGYHYLVLWASPLAAMLLCANGVALAGHDNVDVDPALKRYAGQITALGPPNDKGDIYSFRAKRMYADTGFPRDELRGWRLTLLAGKRFAHVFDVAGNTGDEITVTAGKGPLNGIAVRNVFVVERIPDGSAAQR